MFLKAEEILRMERLYGTPDEERIAVEMGEREWALLRRTQTRGRAHDVTLYVLQGDSLAVIAKHSYPAGVYRAPSGGVMPEESMEEGIAREVSEELGITVSLQRYLLREMVDFLHGGETVLWTTHVFTARPLTTELAPTDHKEIREARWASLQEVSGPIAAALAVSPSAGLRYRGYLHRRVMETLARLESR
jgi:8-oxo-dGTP pyrophosphatase MutT (NUDIX family)